MAWEITDTDAGMICDRSVASLLQAFRKFEDTGRRQHMTYQARAFALRYDQSQIIEQWLEFYRTMRARR
jgi:glycosyltransferase involved in cell wall biosynthesis